MRKLQETVAELRKLVEGEQDDARTRLATNLGTCVGALLNISGLLEDALRRKNLEDARPDLQKLQGYAQGVAARFKTVEGSVPLSGDHRAE